MKKYIVRLVVDSLVRLNQTPYRDGTPSSALLRFPAWNIAVFDKFVEVQGFSLSQGLIVQVELTDDTLDRSLERAMGYTLNLVSTMTTVTLAAVKTPRPEWAYDASPGLEEREFRCYFDDLSASYQTRRINWTRLDRLMRGLFMFLEDTSIKEDWKARVLRAFLAFRRALADNDDVLSEFLTDWATMEGLDCIYRGVFPSRQSKLPDGMRDVFGRLGQASVFDELKNLRDGLAHGHMSLAQAIQLATSHLELTRQALVLMTLRILNVEQSYCDEILKENAYKGKFQPHVEMRGMIGFARPGDLHLLVDHPEYDLDVRRAAPIIQDGKLVFNPTFTLKGRNFTTSADFQVAFWTEAGSGVTVDWPLSK